MKPKLIGALIVILLVALGASGWVGYQLFTTGFSAKTEPHALEIVMARRIRHLAIPIEQRNAVNPVPLSTEALNSSYPFCRALRNLPRERRQRQNADRQKCISKSPGFEVVRHTVDVGW